MNKQENDFDFYADLFLNYYTDVEKMAYKMKKHRLTGLFRNICVFDSQEEQNSGSNNDSADFAELE